MEQLTLKHCINAVANKTAALPFHHKTLRYFFLTPHHDGRALASLFLQQGFESVIAPRRDQLDEEDIMAIIDTCDVFLLISPANAALASPMQSQHNITHTLNENGSYADTGFLWYATSLGKTTIHLSLSAPFEAHAGDRGNSLGPHNAQSQTECLMAVLVDALTPPSC